MLESTPKSWYTGERGDQFRSLRLLSIEVQDALVTMGCQTGFNRPGIYRILAYITGWRQTLEDDNMDQIHGIIQESLDPKGKEIPLFIPGDDQGSESLVLNRTKIIENLSISLFVQNVIAAGLKEEETQSAKQNRENRERKKKQKEERSAKNT